MSTPGGAPASLDEQATQALLRLLPRLAAGDVRLLTGEMRPARLRQEAQIDDDVVLHLLTDRLHASRLLESQTLQWSRSVQRLAQALLQAGPSVGGLLPGETDMPPWLQAGAPLLWCGGPGDDVLTLAGPTRWRPQVFQPHAQAAAWAAVAGGVLAGDEVDEAATEAHLLADLLLARQLMTCWTPPATLSLGVAAVLLCLCARWEGTRHTIPGVGLVDWLVATQGLPQALAALIQAQRLQLTSINTLQGSRSAGYQHVTTLTLNHTITTPLSGDVYDRSRVSETEWRMRCHLTVADAQTYATCEAQIAQALPQIDPLRRPTLAVLLDRSPALSHQLLHQLQTQGPLPPTAYWLQLTVTDPACLALAQRANPGNYTTPLGYDARLVNTLLLEWGVEAVRWLTPYAAEPEAAKALARIGTPEAVQALALAASRARHTREWLAVAVHRWPQAAVQGLAELLGQPRHQRQPLWQATLLTLLQTLPDRSSQQALFAALSVPAQAVLQDLQARLQPPANCAAPDELPPVLVDPPWRRSPRRAQALPVITGLQPLPLPPVDAWEPEARAHALALYVWQRQAQDKVRHDPAKLAQALGFGRCTDIRLRTRATEAVRQGNAQALVQVWEDWGQKERFDGYIASLLPSHLGVPLWARAIRDCGYSDGIRYLAATYGVDGLPGIVASAQRSAPEHLETALHFGAVEIAPLAARALVQLKSARHAAQAWLLRWSEHAACALIAPALGASGEAQHHAATALRWLDSQGQRPLLLRVATRYPESQVPSALQALLDQDPLQRHPARPAPLPPFWSARSWSRPRLHNGKALPDATLDALGTMLSFPITEGLHPGLAQVQAACTRTSLADFAWDGFAAWLHAGAPAKSSWAFSALGVLGDDDTARRLTPYIRAWPGEAAHSRAVAGLEVLAQIGSDVALMQLNGIAQKLKFKALQERAREKIEQIAQARDLTAPELEDRLVPDLGLDERGTLVLDYGPRAFRVGFDEALKPYVQEWIAGAQGGQPGARLSDLPKPKQSDDAALAEAAVHRYKQLKKDARTIARQQVQRLELAMCSRRRWGVSVFEAVLAHHPLVHHVARRLVWGLYLPDGTGQWQLSRCFALDEAGQPVDAQDQPLDWPPPGECQIGLPHPLELPTVDAAAYGQWLGDYELRQPFAQLGRECYALTAAEREALELTRWQGQKVAVGKVLGLLSQGWQRGAPQDAGSIPGFAKPLGAGRVIWLELASVLFVNGAALGDDTQILGRVQQGRLGAWGDVTPEPLGRLDRIVLSELIRDLEGLRG